MIYTIVSIRVRDKMSRTRILTPVISRIVSFSAFQVVRHGNCSIIKRKLHGNVPTTNDKLGILRSYATHCFQ